MGRIKQAADDIRIPPHDRLSLNITQWRYIAVYEEDLKNTGPRIDVCLKTIVTSIEGITLDEFNEINYNNQTVSYKYQYKWTHVPCGKCYGKGVIDWIDKALIGSMIDPIDYFNRGVKYTRNKKGPVNIYKSDLKAMVMYSSTPKLRKGEDFCSECFGCGIQMSKSNRCGETIFT